MSEPAPAPRLVKVKSLPAFRRRQATRTEVRALVAEAVAPLERRLVALERRLRLQGADAMTAPADRTVLARIRLGRSAGLEVVWFASAHPYLLCRPWRRDAAGVLQPRDGFSVQAGSELLAFRDAAETAVGLARAWEQEQRFWGRKCK